MHCRRSDALPVDALPPVYAAPVYGPPHITTATTGRKSNAVTTTEPTIDPSTKDTRERILDAALELFMSRASTAPA